MKKLNKSEGLDLGSIVQENKGANFIFCIGFNSIGKTFSVENGIANMLKDGKRCVGIRNTEKEAIKCVQGGSDTLLRNNMKDQFYVTKSGVFKYSDTSKMGKTKMSKANDELVCPFVFMSSLDTSIPQIDRCRAFVFDEFIAGNEKRVFKIKNPLLDIKKMFFRLSRPATKEEHIPFIFISNPHNLESDILTDFGIDLDGDTLSAGKDIIKEDKKHKTLLLVFPTEGKIKANSLQQNYFSYINDQEAYSFKTNEYKRIIPKISQEKEIIYFFTYKAENYELSKFINEDGYYWLRVERKRDYLNKENIPGFCFLECDKIGNLNIFLDKEHMIDQTALIHQFQLDGNRIIYDSVFTKEQVRELLFERNLVEELLNE